MKTTNFIILACSILLASCAATPPASPQPTYFTTITSEKNSDLAAITIFPIWENASIFNAAGIAGFTINLKNNTNKIARVIWEESSINYNGNSYTLFISGQKYTDASKPMTPTILPALGSMQRDIFSSSQPLFTTGTLGGWRMRTIQAETIEIISALPLARRRNISLFESRNRPIHAMVAVESLFSFAAKIGPSHKLTLTP